MIFSLKLKTNRLRVGGRSVYGVIRIILMLLHVKF